MVNEKMVWLECSSDYDPNDSRHFYGPIDPPRVKLYPLRITLKELSARHTMPHSIYDQVVRSAEILQEENDLPFEAGDIVFHPKSSQLYEVIKVIDNSGRTAFGVGRICLQCKDQNGVVVLLEAATVLHLGYLIDAKSAYKTTMLPAIDLKKEGPETVAEYIVSIIGELGDDKDKEEQV